MDNKNNLKLPARIVVIYLLSTLFLYAFGPLKWITYNPMAFWILNILYILMFVLGWNIGLKTSVSKKTNDDSMDARIVSKLRFLITINFVYEIINSFRRFRLDRFDIGLLINSIIDGLNDMGASYREFQSSIDDTNLVVVGGRTMTMFNLIWAFFAFNILLLGIVYFKKLSVYNRIVMILTITIIVLEYVATGTNIGVFRIVLFFMVIFLIKIGQGKLNVKKHINPKNKRMIILIAILCIVMLTLYDNIMQSRGGILNWKSSTYNVGGVYLNRESLLFRVLPSSLYMLLIMVTSYLSQGYYGMSLSLRLSWEPGYGVGHSMTLMNLFGDELASVHENTYQYRVSQFGWHEGTQWHTMYSWFANDVTYYGVIVIMLIVGIVFAMAYRDAIITNNPYAKLMTYYMAVLAFFIPCNNQLFQSSYVLFAFITATLLWIMTRGRKRVYIVLRRRET